MPKVLKALIYSIATLILLLAIAIIALPYFIDTDSFRQKISDQVKQKTGQTLVIDGELRFSVFPWLGIRTGSLSLLQPEGLSDSEQDKTLLNITEADIKVKLFPLLKKEIEIDTILLRQPQLTYIVAKDGRSSFDGFTQDSTLSTPNISSLPPSSLPSNSPSNNAAAAASIIIAGVSVTDGRIIYVNQQTGERHKLNDFALTTGNLLSDNAAPVQLSAKVSLHQFDPVDITLTTEALIDKESTAVTADNIAISAKQAATGHQVNGNIHGLQFNQQAQLFTLNGVKLKSNIHNLAPTLAIPALSIDLGQYKTSPIDFTLIEDALGLNIKGKVLLKDWQDRLMVRGKITTETFSPKKLLQHFAIDYKAIDDSVLNSMKITTQLSAGLNGAGLKHIEILLDKSQLLGDISIIGFNKPHYRFDLNLDKVNLDHYLPAPDKNNTSKKTTQAKESSPKIAFAAPIGLFKLIKANGTLRVNQLQANGAKLTNFVTGIVSTNNTVTISPKAKLYEGFLDSKIVFNAEKNKSTLTIKKSLSNILLEPLLKDTNITDQLSGRGNITADIVITEKDKTQSNKGVINVLVNDGALK
ncbi:MAG: AsmA family protein, partial [Cellvibrionaceae bacterium]